MSKNTTGIGSLVVDEHELASSGLDLWRIPKVDASMVHGKNQTYFLTGPIKNEGPFEFIIPSESNEYLMLDKTTIYGEVEVVKANDGDLADADLVTTINNFPQTLFSLIKVYLNGVCINDISTATYGFKAYLENHLSYDVNVKKTTLAATEMYIKDAVGEETDIAVNVVKGGTGMNKRNALIKKKKVYFDITPHIDFFRTEQLLLPGVEMKIELVRSPDSFSLLQAVDKTAKIKFHKLECLTRKVILDPKIAQLMENRLTEKPSFYPVCHSKIRTHLLASGIQSTHISQIVRGKLPRSFMFCILDSENFEGNFDKNPFYINNAGLQSLNVLINGEPVHARPIDPDWDSGRCLKEYRWFRENTGQHGHLTNGITLEEYKTNTCVFCYDLSPDLCNGYYKHGLEQGTIDISLSFKNALVKNHTLLFYATFNEAVVIDKNRNITLV